MNEQIKLSAVVVLGVFAGTAIAVVSFHESAGEDFARFLRACSVIAFGITAFYSFLLTSIMICTGKNGQGILLERELKNEATTT